MRLAFIGGNGHHYLLHLLPTKSGDKPAVSLPRTFDVAFAGDGHDPARSRERASNYNVTWYDDARKMLDAFQPDVVSVGATNGYNAHWVVEALKRDIPVVSDKPIATTWEQLDQIRQLIAAKPGRIVLTEYAFRCHPAFCAARDAVSRGAIGQVALVTAQKSYRFGNRPLWYGNRQDYGGTMLWIASHGIDAIRFTTNLRFTSVFGQFGSIQRPDYGTLEDHTSAMFTLDNGATGIVHADLLNPAKAERHGEDRLRIVGSRGLIEIREGRCTLTTNDHSPQDITEQASPRPMAEELLLASQGESAFPFNTELSLELAEVLIHARDAADQHQLIDIAQRVCAE